MNTVIVFFLNLLAMRHSNNKKIQKKNKTTPIGNVLTPRINANNNEIKSLFGNVIDSNCHLGITNHFYVLQHTPKKLKKKKKKQQ